MLYAFLASNKAELIQRCTDKVSARPTVGHLTLANLEHGIPLLIDQLVVSLRAEQSAPAGPPYSETPHEIGHAAGLHGGDLLRRGFTLDQVVHDYGDLCQAITELAHDKKEPITVEEFHTFNRCLDSAIANAVTEFGRLRDRRVADERARTHDDRMLLLAAELRTNVNAAMLSFSAIKTGRVAVSGETGSLLDRSLTRLSDIVERTLAEVRLDSRRHVKRETIELGAFLTHVSVFAVLEATAKQVELVISVEPGLVVDADRELLSSAVAILLQNALRFTPSKGRLAMRARESAERILIEIEDECGGLASATLAELHKTIQAQGGPARDGTGVAICRHAVSRIGGTLGLEDRPQHGCVFTIDLPKRATFS